METMSDQTVLKVLLSYTNRLASKRWDVLLLGNIQYIMLYIFHNEVPCERLLLGIISTLCYT